MLALSSVQKGQRLGLKVKQCLEGLAISWGRKKLPEKGRWVK